MLSSPSSAQWEDGGSCGSPQNLWNDENGEENWWNGGEVREPDDSWWSFSFCKIESLRTSYGLNQWWFPLVLWWECTGPGSVLVRKNTLLALCFYHLHSMHKSCLNCIFSGSGLHKSMGKMCLELHSLTCLLTKGALHGWLAMHFSIWLLEVDQPASWLQLRFQPQTNWQIALIFIYPVRLHFDQEHYALNPPLAFNKNWIIRSHIIQYMDQILQSLFTSPTHAFGFWGPDGMPVASFPSENWCVGSFLPEILLNSCCIFLLTEYNLVFTPYTLL